MGLCPGCFLPAETSVKDCVCKLTACASSITFSDFNLDGSALAVRATASQTVECPFRIASAEISSSENVKYECLIFIRETAPIGIQTVSTSRQSWHL